MEHNRTDAGPMVPPGSKKNNKKPFAFDCKGQKKKHGHGNGRTSKKCQGINHVNYTVTVAFCQCAAGGQLGGLVWGDKNRTVQT